MPSGPLNYSTTIAAKTTASQCQTILGEAGADAVALMFEDKQPVGLSFRLETPAGRRDFAMPVNIDGVHALLQRADKEGRLRHGNSASRTSREQAARVAWRVIKDWLEAQLAIIDAGMVTLDQVMLPYLEVEPGATLYQRFIEQAGPAALTGGPRA